MHVEPLTPTIGAVISGVDLRDPQATSSAELRAVWLARRIVFFRDQQLDPRAQVDAARRFGTPTPAHPLLPGHPDAPEVLVLDSASYELGVGRKESGTSYNDAWHTDVTFAVEPPAATMLRAVTVPESGGDTLWCCLAAAFQSLSPPLRALARSLVAEHSAERVFGETIHGDPAERAARLRALPLASHPVVPEHPETGEELLYVNPVFTRRVLDVTDTESRALLDLFCARLATPEHTIRWRWRRGDVALWDNRSTAHYATADYGSLRRIMHRVTLAGGPPSRRSQGAA